MEPITREALQGLKAKALEEKRRSFIANQVEQIYRAAIAHASGQNIIGGQDCVTSYKYPVQPNLEKATIADILSGVQVLFPDCSVVHTLMARDRKGKLYDISKLDDTILPLINAAMNQSYIVIDWT